MEALLVDAIPTGNNWQYEPKWDGFRALAYREGEKVELYSKSGQRLARYFPEVVESLLGLRARRFVLDGEIVVPVDGELSFDDLLMRIHPAASRIAKLAAETPARYIVFDVLEDERGRVLLQEPLGARRKALEGFAKRHFAKAGGVRLSPATRSLARARGWLAGREGTDGVIAKDITLSYQSGERTGMQKIKRRRTADCVVGGFRYASRGGQVGSMLLGLYDKAGLLHHVGFTSSIKNKDRVELTRKLEALRVPAEKGGGFTGRSPGGPSRWSTERSGQWEPVRPVLVAEVQWDHFTGGRFRHGTKFLRWRPEKKPRACGMEQVERVRRERKGGR
jgi:ATP-dependent DNA ligase